MEIESRVWDDGTVARPDTPFRVQTDNLESTFGRLDRGEDLIKMVPGRIGKTALCGNRKLMHQW